jgi:hypothetical protein
MDFDFGQEVTDLNSVPENFRSAYEEKDGKVTIKSDLVGLTSAITGLNGALRNERKLTAGLRSQKDISAVVREVFGVDSVEEVRAKLDGLETTVAERAKVDPAKIRAEIERTFVSEREALKADNVKMQGALERYLVDSAAATALSSAGGNTKLMMPIIKQMVGVVKDGEDWVVRVRDSAGDYRGDGMGGFMTVEALVKELKSNVDYAAAFKSEVSSGTGRAAAAGRGVGSAAAQQRVADQPTSPVSKIAQGLRVRRGG